MYSPIAHKPDSSKHSIDPHSSFPTLRPCLPATSQYSTVQLNWSPDTLREQSKTYWVKKASFWASRHVGGNGDRPSELARSWALQIERRHRCPDPGQSSFTQNRKGKHVPSAARSTKYCKCFEAVTDKASRTGCRCQPFTVLYTTVHGCTEAGVWTVCIGRPLSDLFRVPITWRRNRQWFWIGVHQEEHELGDML